MKTDRAMLLDLMQQFDTQSWCCLNCGHEEDTASMDMAGDLREFLAANPTPVTSEVMSVREQVWMTTWNNVVTQRWTNDQMVRAMRVTMAVFDEQFPERKV